MECRICLFVCVLFILFIFFPCALQTLEKFSFIYSVCRLPTFLLLRIQKAFEMFSDLALVRSNVTMHPLGIEIVQYKRAVPSFRIPLKCIKIKLFRMRNRSQQQQRQHQH